MLPQEFNKLFDMLTYKRQARSLSEEEFITRFITPYNPSVDTYGNLSIVVGDSSTIFTAHTDSVHRDSGLQTPQYDAVLKNIHAPHNEVLGADDATGIFIMLHMIDNSIPGLYIFFRDEEIGGGLGSTWYVKNTDIPVQYNKVVSFDRNSYTHDVITAQYKGTCSSDIFAGVLAGELRAYTRMLYTPNPRGIFTDSANFPDDFERTNISVGYFNEHTVLEYQDLNILTLLLPAVLKVNWDCLPVDTVDPLDDEWASLYDDYPSEEICYYTLKLDHFINKYHQHA